ncbi:MAG TPA: KUP/HAK/KT family potassium transporter [Candidatus Elarobacter sp.]|nr:KUP/HAK/KT family potassium transporter [Candidatus Elarobacter sp.]
MSDLAEARERREDPTLAATAESVDRAPRALGALAVGALGVVFGDIGTSPLYAFRQCFLGAHAPRPDATHVLGVCSLIVWALVGVVCVKYVGFVLRADYQGQGGTLALLAQFRPSDRTGSPPRLTWVVLLVLLGSALLYGDGAITPAISVVSALEGVGVVTTAAQAYVVPLAAVLLLALFALQPRGTGYIGKLFGPIMLLWFLTIAGIGANAIVHHPEVLRALDPRRALGELLSNGPFAVLLTGAIVLCVSGVEALYADLAHFGRGPITLAWYALVFPALVLNYLGQGAALIADPRALQSPFYALVAGWAVIPMVVLATAATIIASQALISGVFSLTQQAVRLGYFPRLDVVHTSRRHAGQIFVPVVNVLLAIATTALVVAFRSSDRMGSAYGLAVTGTMITTTIAYAVLVRAKWRWPAWQVALVTALFLAYDLPFLAGNLPKVLVGGWVPLSIGLVVFTLLQTWTSGWRKVVRRLVAGSVPVEDYVRETRGAEAHRLEGTAVFLTNHPEGVPYVAQHKWLRAHISYDTVVLLTILSESVPYVSREQQVASEQLGEGLIRVTARYGFMEQPKLADVIRDCSRRGDLDLREASYFVPDPRLERSRGKKRMRAWQRALFAFMLRNEVKASDLLDVPADQIVQVGVAVPV